MSRVQKGGAIFKPSPKTRPRPALGAASRQASLVLEAPTEPTALGLMQPPVSTQLTRHSSTGPSLSQPPLVLAGRGVLQDSPSVPFVSDQRQHPLPPSTPSKSTQLAKGNLIPAPLRSSATPVAIAIPRPLSQRPSGSAPENAMLNALPPTQVDIPPRDILQERSSASESGPTSPVQIPAPRKRRHSTATPDDEASSTYSKTKAGRGRRSRAPSLPPYDQSIDPGDDLDPTVVTMASLCNDTGQGRVSSKAAEILNNHATWKKQNREKRSRMRDLMEARKYGRTEQEAELNETGAISPPPSITPSTSIASSVENADKSSPDFDYSQDLATSRYNVQVRIGPNGETVIDEESLVVNREETEETANYTHVTESDTSKFVNSGTYAKRFRGSRWSAEETEMFYDALMQHGENYELIAYMLPGRDRKSCKNKFKVEDKRNPARINYCLNHRTAPDIAYLSLMTGKDFSGPTPEIRAPSRPPTVAERHEEEEVSTSNAEDGLVIISDADAAMYNSG